MLSVVKDFTTKTVQKAAEIAVKTGSTLYTDSAKSYGALVGYKHDSVNHSLKEYARDEVHENRAENCFSLLRPFLAGSGVCQVFCVNFLKPNIHRRSLSLSPK